jgi:two-component system cell cycle sensor histidine kinase/response regulator CckA
VTAQPRDDGATIMPAEAGDRYRLLFESHPVAMAVWDPATGEILAANDAALRQYGYDDDEIVGLRIERLVHPDDLPRLQAAVPRFSAGVNGAAPFRHVRRDGSVIEVEVTGHEIRWNDRQARLVMAIDVTERRQLEAQLRQAQKMEAIGRLAGGVAHDFNNLLTAIGGYTRLLIDSLDEDDPRREDAMQVEAAAGRAATLTQQLLAFSRGGMIQPTRLDLNAIVAELEGLLGRMLGEAVELRLELRARTPWVLADRSQLEQLLVNLAVNAADAMPDGGKLAIETDDLDAVTAWRQGLTAGGYVSLTVSDTGVGIAEDVREQVFEPFFTTKAQGEGTGLGLATVYATVRQAGGRIRLLSEPGRGTTFRILLPVAPAAEGATAGAEAEPPAAVAAARILVVEDEAAVRDLVARILGAAGHDISTAADGAEALRVADAANPPIELILSDVVMPGMSGIQLAREVRARWPTTRIVLMSGYTAEPLEAAGSGLVLLPKPFSADELLEHVRAALLAPSPAD